MQTLQEAFAQVPDPRGSRGKRYPLAIFLLLVLLATMSGEVTITATTGDFGLVFHSIGFPSEWGGLIKPVFIEQ